MINKYKALKWQDEFHRSKARYRILACGRRSGKTEASAIEIIRHAAKNNNWICWWVGPISDQSKIGFRKVIKYIPPEWIKQITHVPLVIYLINGSYI